METLREAYAMAKRNDGALISKLAFAHAYHGMI
jgi:hypothetical protein